MAITASSSDMALFSCGVLQKVRRLVPSKREVRQIGAASVAVKRLLMGKIIIAARILGGILIALAILDLPQMEFLPAGLVETFRLISSIALVVAGIAWLVGVQLFIRFFDQYLSRN